MSKFIISMHLFFMTLFILSCNKLTNPTEKENTKDKDIVINQEYCFNLTKDYREIKMVFIPNVTGYYHFSNKESNYNPSFSPEISVNSESKYLGYDEDNDIAIMANVYLEGGKQYSITGKGKGIDSEVMCCIKIEFDSDDNRYLCEGYKGNRSFFNSLVGTIDHKNDVDEYELYSDEESYIHITVSDLSEPTDFNPYVEIFDENGKRLANDTKNDIATISNIPLLANKLYKVKVKCNKNFEYGNYKIELEKDKDDFEKLVEGNIYNGKIDKVNDIDLFNFELNTNDGYYHIIANESYNPFDLDPYIEIFDREKNKRIANENDYSQAELVNINLLNNCRYKINVRDNRNSNSGYYFLKIFRDYDDDKTLSNFNNDLKCKIDFKEDVDKIIYFPNNKSDVIRFESGNIAFRFAVEIYDETNKRISNYTSKDNMIEVNNNNLNVTQKYYFKISSSNKIASEYSVILKK